MLKNLRRLFGHVVSGFIPDKYTARRVRANIEYGIFRKIKESRILRRKEKKSKYKYNLAIVAIMKNEGAYIKEWIDFHRIVGVEKFYLYDNDSTDDTRKILNKYIKAGIVDYTFYPGEKRQLPAYNDCIAKHKNETKWLAVIDLDEYLVPVVYDSVPEFLNTLDKSVAQVIIPWVVFGSNGHETKPDGLVLESYTKRARHSWLYKAIINPRLVFHMGCHEHNVAGRTISVNKSKIRVHHYHCKSWEEYKHKAMRGDAWDGANAGMQKYQRECFKKHDLNDVVDKSALRFVEKLKGLKSK